MEIGSYLWRTVERTINNNLRSNQSSAWDRGETQELLSFRKTEADNSIQAFTISAAILDCPHHLKFWSLSQLLLLGKRVTTSTQGRGKGGSCNITATPYQWIPWVLTHWKRLWCWEGLGAGGEGDDQGWDGWMASLTRWMWVWVNSGRWWWTGRPGVLWFMGSQRVGHDWATELNWKLYTLLTSQVPERTKASPETQRGYQPVFEQNGTKYLCSHSEIRCLTMVHLKCSANRRNHGVEQ